MYLEVLKIIGRLRNVLFSKSLFTVCYDLNDLTPPCLRDADLHSNSEADPRTAKRTKKSISSSKENVDPSKR
jgi:hypothetical protein